MGKSSYESEFYKLSIDDQILTVSYTGGPITLDIAKDLVVHRLELAEGKEMPVLVNVIDVKGIDREARNFLSTPEGLLGLKAGAIVSDSAFTKHMANFFMKISFNKSKMPAKVFSDKDDAINWLKRFV